MSANLLALNDFSTAVMNMPTPFNAAHSPFEAKKVALTLLLRNKDCANRPLKGKAQTKTHREVNRHIIANSAKFCLSKVVSKLRLKV